MKDKAYREDVGLDPKPLPLRIQVELLEQAVSSQNHAMNELALSLADQTSELNQAVKRIGRLEDALRAIQNAMARELGQ